MSQIEMCQRGSESLYTYKHSARKKRPNNLIFFPENQTAHDARLVFLFIGMICMNLSSWLTKRKENQRNNANK